MELCKATSQDFPLSLASGASRSTKFSEVYAFIYTYLMIVNTSKCIPTKTFHLLLQPHLSVVLIFVHTALALPAIAPATPSSPITVQMEEAIEDALTSKIHTSLSHAGTTLNDDDDLSVTSTTTYNLKTIEPSSSMAQQGSEALNRTFTELKSKDEDRRRLAAYDLYQLVSTASRGKRLEVFRHFELTEGRTFSGQVSRVLQ